MGINNTHSCAEITFRQLLSPSCSEQFRDMPWICHHRDINGTCMGHICPTRRHICPIWTSWSQVEAWYQLVYPDINIHLAQFMEPEVVSPAGLLAVNLREEAPGTDADLQGART